MELKPDLGRLMRREIYTFLTITTVIVICTLIIQALVVILDPEVTNDEFVRYVWSWVAGLLIAGWVIVPWFQYLWIINLKYVVDDERLVIHKGILFKKSVSIPYSAITDFTLARSLYERWLEIGTLLVQTAGQGAQAGGHEGRLEGLVEFEALHTELRAKIKVYQGNLRGGKTAPSEVVEGDDVVLVSILEEIKKINRKLK
ncbi:MAG: PH domain-containing protein [FCB group bacterium]|nr:PH domain-containing protein [FCB group bacterium]MBL7028721.1 PH domain-containing protein [Candidatus Neomarinimicrobiota bacterium]MBL7120675.1 PH domain-containing protein [Candidatus Neomarinimicrobiota bacterium]